MPFNILIDIFYRTRLVIMRFAGFSTTNIPYVVALPVLSLKGIYMAFDIFGDRNLHFRLEYSLIQTD